MAEVKLKEETELWEPRGPCGSWGPAEEHTHSEAVEPAHLKDEPELCIKQEPQEFPFHMVTVKSEDDEDKSSVLHQRPTEENREETNGAEAGCSSDPLTQFHSDSEEHTDSSEDTDHSEDYSQEQAPAKRSYAMVPPDAAVRDKSQDKAPHSCPECGMNIRWKSQLQRHMLSHTGKKPYKCPECGKSFRWKSKLWEHKFSHTREGPHKCPVCEKTFLEKGQLTYHLRNKHHMCPVCEACFPDNVNLKKHLKTHVEDGTLHQSILKPYICSECGMEFKKMSHLQEHMFSHSGEKPHKCPECGKRFTRKSYVKRHMVDHMGEKPYKCSVCVKSFKDKYCVIKHEKNFHNVCRICERGFKHETARKLHMKTHQVSTNSDLKPYRCLECGRRFPSVAKLQKHISVHSEKRKLHLESHVDAGTVKDTSVLIVERTLRKTSVCAHTQEKKLSNVQFVKKILYLNGKLSV